MTILNTLEQMWAQCRKTVVNISQKKKHTYKHAYQSSTDKKMIEGPYHSVSAESIWYKRPLISQIVVKN